MATSRSAAGVAVMDNCIYVVGGYDGNTDLNTVSLIMSSLYKLNGTLSETILKLLDHQTFLG